jgi:hypothetical protein
VRRGARLVAAEVKATRVQSPDTDTSYVGASDWLPWLPTETRVIASVRASQRKASATPLVSPRTRFDASETNATHRAGRWPSPLTDGPYERPFAGCPPKPRDTSTVLPACHGDPWSSYGSPRTTANTSVTPFVSAGVMSLASDSNAMMRAKRSSRLTAAFLEGPFGTPP